MSANCTLCTSKWSKCVGMWVKASLVCRPTQGRVFATFETRALLSVWGAKIGSKWVSAPQVSWLSCLTCLQHVDTKPWQLKRIRKLHLIFRRNFCRLSVQVDIGVLDLRPELRLDLPSLSDAVVKWEMPDFTTFCCSHSENHCSH